VENPSSQWPGKQEEGQRTLGFVYALSGFCFTLVAVLLTGFSGHASLGTGDDYLLPSIAVVVVSGTLITGGRDR
jgi:ribose transport system permease protein